MMRLLIAQSTFTPSPHCWQMNASIREKIAKDVKAVASDPTILDRMTATGQIVSPGDGEEFAKSIAEQKAQVEAVAKLFGGKQVQ